MFADDSALYTLSINEASGLAITKACHGAVGAAGLALPADGRHAMTAAHCVDWMPTTPPFNTWYVRFDTQAGAQTLPFTRTTTSGVYIHDNWDGDPANGYDIAIIDLEPDCLPTCNNPLNALERYDVFRDQDDSDLAEFVHVGYGITGTGFTGQETPGDGLKRTGRNRFEVVADALNGTGTSPYNIPGNLISVPDIQLAFDFDNNSDRENEVDCLDNHPQNAGCDALHVYLGEPEYEDPVGFGDDEVTFGVGDSGGPNFVDGKIAGVASWPIWWKLVTDLDPSADRWSHFGEIAASTRVSRMLDWIDIVVDITAPRVASVLVGSSQNNHPDYTLLSEGNQLRTIPVAEPNEIMITFSEDVEVDISSLAVESVLTSTQYTPTGFEYPATGYPANTAKWTFPNAIGPSHWAEQVIVTLTDVTDANGVRLDAEWENPTASNDPSGSEFPSGDGSADGTNTFVFYLAFAPGDFNLDNVVDGSDFGVWNANKFTGNTVFTEGDGNGDNATDGSDYGVWNAMEFTDCSSWGSGCQLGLLRGGEGGRGLHVPSAAWFEEYDRLVDFHHIFIDGQVNNTLTNEDWERFADALILLLDRIY